jgi:hypothetical protein
MGALLPISDSPEREVEPGRKLLLRQIQPLAQCPHSRHAASTRKLRLGGWRGIRVRNGGSMTLFVAHGVEGPPICLGRPLRTELKSRDTSFFHAASPTPSVLILITFYKARQNGAHGSELRLTAIAEQF